MWALILASMLWGTTGTAASFLPDSVSPLAVGASTMTIGGLLLFAVSARPALAAVLLRSHHAPKDLPTRVMDRMFGWFFRPFNRFFEATSRGYVGVVRRIVALRPPSSPVTELL